MKSTWKSNGNKLVYLFAFQWCTLLTLRYRKNVSLILERDWKLKWPLCHWLSLLTYQAYLYQLLAGWAHDVTFLKNDVCIRQIEISVCYYIEAYYPNLS